MKNLKPIVVLVCSIAILKNATAQAGIKPKLFQNYPQQIVCSETALQQIFTTLQGQAINVNLENSFSFNGTLISTESKYNNLQAAIVKSPQFDNAFFNVIKVVQQDGSIIYSGSILNPNYADGYKLSKTDAGFYVLNKVEVNKLLPSCHQ